MDADDRKALPVIDLDLNRDQLLGRIPTQVLERLWPDFEPQDLDVHVNPVLLRRHLQGKPDYVTRVAAFNEVCERLDGCLSNAVAYARYDSVPDEEAGLNIFIELSVATERPNEFFMLGVRLFKKKRGGGRRNFVATALPPMNRARMHKKLASAKKTLLVESGRFKETD